MNIALLSDAWVPQTSGVVTTLLALKERLEAKGHNVLIIHPGMFFNISCPTYPQIKLALFAPIQIRRIKKILNNFKPDAIHIPVEGPIGIAGRNYCCNEGIPFTTSYTTKFPEYINMRFGLNESYIYNSLKWFHNSGNKLMVSTQSLENHLKNKGFKNIARWVRGVNVDLFRPINRNAFDGLPKPIMTYLGRVSVEKNLEEFLSITNKGTKVIIGDGPELSKLKSKYKDVLFLGRKTGEEMIKLLSSSDVFVFPSLTDTFGIVLIESLACGVPVAAHPVTGPIDILEQYKTGYMCDDLEEAIDKALLCSPEYCREFVCDNYTWDISVNQFESNLVRI